MGQEVVVIHPPGVGASPGFKQVIALDGKPEGHGQGHDHPQKEHRHGRREQQSAVMVVAWICCGNASHLRDLPSSACSVSTCASASACGTVARPANAALISCPTSVPMA